MITTVVFDLGGVLIDWNPRYLFRKLFKDPAAMEVFLRDVTTHDWNASLDEGRDFAEAVELLSAQHPAQADLISAYRTRWPEMLGESIGGTVEILRELKGRYRLLALSNWSAETFPYALERFDFLRDFETILVSGREKLIKPNPAFYQLLESRLGVHPSEAVFIDDVQKNINAAAELGFATIRFENPSQLRDSLRAEGVQISNS